MNEPNKFFLVVFKKENNVDVVPSSWTFVKDGAMYSFWPRLKTLEEVHLAARDEDSPNVKTWAKYQIRVLNKFGDYQKAVDSVEHYLANSDYQESESSLHASLASTPVSHIKKHGSGKTCGRNLSKGPDFAAPKPPAALLNAARTGSTVTQSARSKPNACNRIPVSVEAETSMSRPFVECQILSVHGPSAVETEFSRGDTDFGVGNAESPEFLDISNSYLTLDNNPQEISNAMHCEGACEEFWQHYKRFHANILTMLEKLSSTQALLDRKLDEVVDKIENLKIKQGQDRDPVSFAFRSILPFNTSDDLILFSDSLKADGAKRKAFVKFLIGIGGKDVSDQCYAIMKRLMTDEVALKFSFLGTASKLSFQALEVNSVIFDALQSNKHLLATEKVIRERIMQFFNHAKDRIKSRGKGANKKSQKNQEDLSEESSSS